MQIDVRASYPTARRRGILVALLATLLILAFATPSLAARGAVKISEDPFGSVAGAVGQHATEVEPDSFAFRRTIVTAFQTGRVFDGGSTDIGFATSFNGGATWTHGFLPAVTTAATPPGPYFAASDASVAFDRKHHTWIISYLGIHAAGGGGAVDVVVSRSTDGGRTWGNPVAVAATGTFFDKNWTACDNSPRSRFFGNCYTEFDDADNGDLELMSTSTDGGQSWGAPLSPADQVHGLGGQPVVQPNGRVVVPFSGITGGRSVRAFASDDGGKSWTASVLVSPVTSHRVAGNLRTSPLPTAELNRDGTVYVAWQDSRFEPGGTANDIVFTSSADGTTWAPVQRIPTDAVGGNVDHFIPGLGINAASAGSHTQLALAYYFYPQADCTADTCRLQVGFTSSVDNGRTWTAPKVLAGPMSLSQLANTTQGPMTGDYISTSFVPNLRRALPIFAVGLPPAGTDALNEPMFTSVQKVHGGTHRAGNDRVLFTNRAAQPATAPTTL
jgi:BNR repeat-like domain